MRARQHSTGEDDENTPSSASSSSYSGDEYNTSMSGVTSPIKLSRHANNKSLPRAACEESEHHKEQSKALIATAFLEAAAYEQTAIELLASKRKLKIEYDEDQENQQQQQQLLQQQQQQQQQQQRVQLIKSSPAYKLNSNKNNNNNSNNNNNNTSNSNNNNNSSYYREKSHRNAVQHHRQDDKENNTSSAEAATAAAAAAAAATTAAAAAAAAVAAVTATPNGNNSNNSNNNTATPFLTQMEYQNLNRIGTQFQNYVKDIINKYYAAETPLMLAAAAAALPTATTTGQQREQREREQELTYVKRRRMLSETEEYIEYLRNKEDITLTITPKVSNNTINSSNAPLKSLVAPAPQSLLKRQLDLATPRKSPKKAAANQNSLNNSNNNSSSNSVVNSSSRKSLNQLATLLPLLADAASKQEYLTAPLDFSKKSEAETARSSRKQAQPKKMRLAPEVVIAMLRDKHLNRLVHNGLSCASCSASRRRNGGGGISFSHHTLGSLALHRFWKHRALRVTTHNNCKQCSATFERRYSLKLHQRLKHAKL